MRGPDQVEMAEELFWAAFVEPDQDEDRGAGLVGVRVPLNPATPGNLSEFTLDDENDA